MSAMIVIGSKALLTLTGETQSQRFCDRDMDVVMSEAQLQAFFVRNQPFIRSLVPSTPYKHTAILERNGRRYSYEIETDRQGSSAWLLENQSKISAGTYTDPFGNTFAVPRLEVLFLTKQSHIHQNIHFDKNIVDFHHLKAASDPATVASFRPYFELRHQEALARHAVRHPKLNVSNDAFFNRSKRVVGYVFVHDDLHEAIKHFDRPVYERMKTDQEKAWCDKDLFAQLPLSDRIKCVQEEAYVIALERSIVLEKGAHHDHFLAYKDAMRRICTTLCSGFFRDFAIEHYPAVMEAYDASFFDRFQRALAAGAIRRIDSCSPATYDSACVRLLGMKR